MAEMTAGLAVVEALRAEGVEYIFGICGSTTNNIVTELYGRTDIKFLDTRHEQDAALMAYGYCARLGQARGVPDDVGARDDQPDHRHRARLQGPRAGDRDRGRRASAIISIATARSRSIS